MLLMINYFSVILKKMLCSYDTLLIDYEYYILFLISVTLCSYKVELSGLGAEMRVEIKRNLPRSELKLGTLRVGETVTKTVPIVNRSAASAEFNLSIVSNIPELQAKPGFSNFDFF